MRIVALLRILLRKLLLGAPLGAALVFIVAGALLWSGFNAGIEMTNSMAFCTSCHEMRDYVYPPYSQSAHYSNRSGTQITCADCHVPGPWILKIIRKIKSGKETLHKMLGSIDTQEKYDAKRIELAMNVWRSMKASDSRECRACHDFDSMRPALQSKAARMQHAAAMQAGHTCIDCHKGIVHPSLQHKIDEAELAAISQPDSTHKHAIAAQWQTFIDNGMKLPGERDKPAAELGIPVGASAFSGVDWSTIEAAQINLFYPGQASIEWILDDEEHGGVRYFKKGDRCIYCHEDEENEIGERIVRGELHEPMPIPGKRGSIPLVVQAAYDANNLYMRFQWPQCIHAPVPFVDGGKMDPVNPIKLAIMLTSDNSEDPAVEFADRAGCWQSCHHDAYSMPHHPDAAILSHSRLAARLDLEAGVTKYLKESRSELRILPEQDNGRGGWDKLLPKDDIQAALQNGRFMDLLQYRSGEQSSRDGYVLAERIEQGGQGVRFTGERNHGRWSVEMIRRLHSDTPGDISLDAGQIYNIGIAIHDDYSNARFHHVSLGYKLGFENEDTEINAVDLTRALAHR